MFVSTSSGLNSKSFVKRFFALLIAFLIVLMTFQAGCDIIREAVKISIKIYGGMI